MNREDIQIAYAGDIVALAGLKDTTTATPVRPNAPIIPSGWNSRSGDRSCVEPRPKADQEEDGRRAHRLARDDPSFRVTTDMNPARRSSREWRAHLEILVDRMKREFKVEANVGAPRSPTASISRSRSS